MNVSIGHVTGRRVDRNRDGQEPGRLLQVAFSDVERDIQTVEMPQPGSEYNPPVGCRVVAVQGGSAYKLAVMVDDGIAPVMDPGGQRLYATDAEGEAAVADLRLHPTGEVEVFNGEVALTLAPDGAVTVVNGAASFTMSAAGEFTFHGTASHFDHSVTVTGDITATGTVTGTTDVIAATFSGKSHIHTGGTISGKTGAPTP